MKIKALSAFCLTLLTAFAVKAADLVSADEKFVKSVNDSGLMEVQVAELGVKKATSADVKALAEMMVKDHTALNKELAAVAKNKGAQLSSAADPSTATTIKDLELYKGEEFDKEFLKVLRDGHEKSVKNFKDAAENAKDGEVKAFAGKNLPTIEAHLEHIKKLQK